MAEDAGHKAMLYFLEILMHSNIPHTISQLAGHFGSRTFTNDMRQAAGGNEAGLKKFLQKYPSLFVVNGNLVSYNDGTASGSAKEGSPASSTSSHPEINMETEAVNYFRTKLASRKEKYLPVKSLAGHLSQAPVAIRECVGPQNEFLTWLLRHPLIFHLDGENVILKNSYTQLVKESKSGEALEKRLSSSIDYSTPTKPPQTPKDKRKRPQSLYCGREHHTSELVNAPQTSTPKLVQSNKAGPITMTANEYKAVMYLKNIVEKKGNVKLGALAGLFHEAPESLRNTIGWGRHEIEKFLRQHDNIFILDADDVSLKKNVRLNVIITGSKPQRVPQANISDRKGKVYHVAKLWAIIDLGRHEHVFIDRQIFGKGIDDVSQVLSVGETVCFDAIAAVKGSRAKWRATKIWTENESIDELIERVSKRLNLNLDGVPTEPRTPTISTVNIDEEMRRFIPELETNSILMPSPTVNIGGVRYSFSDAAPSGAGVIPVWNFKHVELEGLQDVDDLDLDSSLESDGPSLSMVTERHFMNRSVLSDSRQNTDKKPPQTSTPTELTNGHDGPTKKKTCDMGCQTIVTGEVLATQLYHEDDFC